MKRKTKVKRETGKALIEARRRIVDEFGKLDVKIGPLKPQVRRHEELASLIRSWYADADTDASVTATGAAYSVTLGPCGSRTRVSEMPEVYRLVGREKFFEYASVTLKALEACGLDETAIASLTTKERTGYRPIVLVRPAGG